MLVLITAYMWFNSNLYIPMFKLKKKYCTHCIFFTSCSDINSLWTNVAIWWYIWVILAKVMAWYLTAPGYTWTDVDLSPKGFFHQRGISEELLMNYQCKRLRAVRRPETGNFWSGPRTFYTFFYKLMFQFLKILIRTGNFFSLVLNTFVKCVEWKLHQRSRLRRPISKIRMILLMDAKTWMTSLIIMFAVRPICVQDSICKISSESPVHFFQLLPHLAMSIMTYMVTHWNSASRKTGMENMLKKKCMIDVLGYAC